MMKKIILFGLLLVISFGGMAQEMANGVVFEDLNRNGKKE